MATTAKNKRNFSLKRTNEKLVLKGEMRSDNFRKVNAALHDACEKRLYPEVTLDFSGCDSAFATSVIPICSYVRRLRADGYSFIVVLPDNPRLKKLFVNANWAHLLCPEEFKKSDSVTSYHVSAMDFDEENQALVVDKVMNAILESLSGIERSGLRALEWSLTEITDNVVSHSDSELGGLIQLNTFRRTRSVEFVVCDAGIGIPKSIRKTDPKMQSDTMALRKAIEEGYTSVAGVHKGNGLFGSYAVCKNSKGKFEINSGYSRLLSSRGKDMRILKDNIPFLGTCVAGKISLDDPGLLQKSLRFGGVAHQPGWDYIEKRFEKFESDELLLRVNEHKHLLGTRQLAKKLKIKATNLLAATEKHYPLYIDFEGIHVVSSSVADEFIGKLFIDIGKDKFKRRVRIVNANEDIIGLLERAIAMEVGDQIRL